MTLCWCLQTLNFRKMTGSEEYDVTAWTLATKANDNAHSQYWKNGASTVCPLCMYPHALCFLSMTKWVCAFNQQRTGEGEKSSMHTLYYQVKANSQSKYLNINSQSAGDFAALLHLPYSVRWAVMISRDRCIQVHCRNVPPEVCSDNMIYLEEWTFENGLMILLLHKQPQRVA